MNKAPSRRCAAKPRSISRELSPAPGAPVYTPYSATVRSTFLCVQERVITSAVEPSMTVSTSSQPVLNFCANNYLGLSNHPRVVEAAKRTLDTHGLGSSSVRFCLRSSSCA